MIASVQAYRQKDAATREESSRIGDFCHCKIKLRRFLKHKDSVSVVLEFVGIPHDRRAKRKFHSAGMPNGTL
jgi:hypothetical protein